MKKLILSMIAVILIGLLIFNGCGKTTSSQTATTSAPSKTVAPPTASSTAPQTSAPGATTTPAPTTKGPQQYGGILRMTPQTSPGGPIGWPPESLGEIANLQQFALEPLIKKYWDGHIEGRLATSWKVADDKASITFSLRKGVKFHDGSDFNAKVVKFNYDNLLAAKLPIASYVSSVNLVDDYTVKFNLKMYVNTLMSNFYAMIVSQAAYEKNGVEYMRNNIVGTGPFKLAKYTRDVSAEFVRNPDYWDTGKPYLDGVKVVWIADPLTASAALQAGDIDVAQFESGSVAASLRDKRFAIDTRTSGMICIIFDSANADSPFANQKVRQAVEYAIDKEALVKAKGYGFWKAAYQLPPAGTVVYDPNFKGRQYDPAKAKQLLAEAGYPNGFKWRLVVSPLGTDKDVAAGIQNSLSKVGIDISVEFPVYSKYLEYRQVAPWSGAMLMQPCLMPANFNQFFSIYMTTTSGIFKSMLRPPGLDDKINASLQTIDPDVKQMKSLADYVYDQALLIPIHDTQNAVVYFPNRIHDAGYLTLDDSFSWLPWNAWMSK